MRGSPPSHSDSKLAAVSDSAAGNDPQICCRALHLAISQLSSSFEGFQNNWFLVLRFILTYAAFLRATDLCLELGFIWTAWVCWPPQWPTSFETRCPRGLCSQRVIGSQWTHLSLIRSRHQYSKSYNQYLIKLHLEFVIHKI